MNPKSALSTSAEIARRLRIVSELRNLSLSLGRARCGEAASSRRSPNCSDHDDARMVAPRAHYTF